MSSSRNEAKLALVAGLRVFLRLVAAAVFLTMMAFGGVFFWYGCGAVFLGDIVRGLGAIVLAAFCAVGAFAAFLIDDWVSGALAPSDGWEDAYRRRERLREEAER